MRLFSTLVLVFAISLLLADGVAPAGDGSLSAPYQVTSLDNLLWISTNSTSWASHFQQIDDIDASGTNGWNDGEGFLPIGDASINFTGGYDGQGHTIDGLFINRTTSDIGLFGKVNNAAVISNMGLTNCNITGNNRTGGIVGFLRGTAILEQCWCTGSVTGNEKVGGLAGYMRDTAVMQRCYNEASVDIFEYGGGLCGVVDDNAHVINCYNKGYVDGSCFIGGVTGCCEGATLTNCYNIGEVWGDFPLYTCGVNGLEWPNTDINNCCFDWQTSGVTQDYGGSLYSTDAMTTMSTFTDIGWDFIDEAANGTDDVWGMHYLDNDGYPFLAWQGFTHFPPAGTEPSGGGLSTNPYFVNSLDNLLWVTTHPESWDKYFVQTQDINAATTATWDGGEGFPPIGYNGVEFTGL